MISPIRLSLPTRTSSYMAAPAMWSATTTGPDTFLMKLHTFQQEPSHRPAYIAVNQWLNFAYP